MSQLYPLPYRYYDNGHSGKDTDILGTPWRVGIIAPTEPTENNPRPRKIRQAYGVFAVDGMMIATLENGNSVAVAERLIDAINKVVRLRTAWDLAAAEQILPLHHHISGLHAACQSFLKERNVETGRARTGLHAEPGWGWMVAAGELIDAVGSHRRRRLPDPALRGALAYQAFWSDGSTATPAARIYYDLYDEQIRKTLFILLGYDRRQSPSTKMGGSELKTAMQALRLYGETLTSTLQAFLDLNPHNPNMPDKFVASVIAMRTALPILKAKIDTWGLTPLHNRMAYAQLGVMKTHIDRLEDCFTILDESVERVQGVLSDPYSVDKNCSAHIARMKQAAQDIARQNKEALPLLPFGPGKPEQDKQQPSGVA